MIHLFSKWSLMKLSICEVRKYSRKQVDITAVVTYLPRGKVSLVLGNIDRGREGGILLQYTHVVFIF